MSLPKQAVSMGTVQKSVNLNGKTLTLEVGRLAQQANAAVLGRLGDTMVLATVCSSEPREDLDYFPLSVEYIERLYAGGRISSSRFIKREGRPTETAILTGRLIDRSIRPLFPKDFFDETQVIITVLSVDNENDPDVLAITTVSAALAISDIPWTGPLAGVRIGYKDGSYLLNPTAGESIGSSMDLVVSSTKEAIVMVEAGMNEIQEDIVIGALEYAHKESQPILDCISQLQKEVGQKKRTYVVKELEEEVKHEIEKMTQEKTKEIVKLAAQKKAPENALSSISKSVFEALPDVDRNIAGQLIDKCFKEFIRGNILAGERPDGRKFEEIRPIEIEVGLLPRTHGSAIFKRGETQALTVATLGSPTLEQIIEGMEGEATKRYMHYYNFPPFSVGETGRIGSPGRREIGHGALAERALIPVIPPEEKFPYTIRVVSEIMSSNGSTSMASVCGSTLSLMDAGVPITAMIAGIAMGLVTNKDGYEILTDIIGMEDHCGDMDFKVAGSSNGITALQMDIKITGTTREILKEALNHARNARLSILKSMELVLKAPRARVSPLAPKIAVIHIDPSSIGELIGPGGKMIRRIISETQCAIDVEDDGKVTISGMDSSVLDKAVEWVEGLTHQAQPGEEYEGEVKRMMSFGAFVEFLPGKEGLVHLSKMSTQFVARPEDVVHIGQKVKVRVTDIDPQGRVNLSMLSKEEENHSRPARKEERYQGGFQSRLQPHARFHKPRY